jgi:hypothetical protein
MEPGLPTREGKTLVEDPYALQIVADALKPHGRVAR